MHEIFHDPHENLPDPPFTYLMYGPLFIKKREEAGMCLDDPNPKAFIEYSYNMNDVYNNIKIINKIPTYFNKTIYFK